MRNLLNLNQDSQRLFNRYFILIWIVSLFLNMGQQMLNNVVSLYINSLGFSTGFSGLLGLPYASFAILVRIVGGYFIDNKGRRLVLVFGCVLFAVAVCLFSAFPAMWTLLLFRGLQGAGFSAAHSAGSTANVDVTPPERSNEGIGYYWIAMAVALALSGYLVLGLIQGTDYTRVFAVAAIFLLLGGVFAFLSNYEKKPLYKTRKISESTDEKFKGILRFFEVKSLPPAIIMFLVSCGTASISTFILLFAVQQGYANSGFFFTLCAVTMFLGNVFSGHLIRHFGPVATLVPTLALFSIGLLFLGLTDSEGLYYMAGAIYGLAQGICFPTLYSLGVKGLPINRRGAGGGTVYLALDIGVGTGSVVWGMVIKAAGFPSAFCSASVVQVLAILFVISYYRSQKRRMHLSNPEKAK